MAASGGWCDQASLLRTQRPAACVVVGCCEWKSSLLSLRFLGLLGFGGMLVVDVLWAVVGFGEGSMRELGVCWSAEVEAV